MKRSAIIAVLLLATHVSAELRVEFVAADELRAAAGEDDRLWEYRSAGGVLLRLYRTPAAADVVNPHASDSFQPVSVARLEAVLRQMPQLDGPPIDVRVHCLPGLPVAPRQSFAQGNEIFLIPALGETSEQALAANFVHELGHVVQAARMPGRRGVRWLDYLRLRGIDDPAIHHEGAAHRDRPAEIFAEDFRLLYGGPLGRASDRPENAALSHPRDVVGLGEFFQGLLGEGAVVRAMQLANHPNPFNPSTVLRAQLPEHALLPGALAQAQVFDLRGRLLRELPPQPVAALVEIVFDGRDAAGQLLASGVYLYRVVAPDCTMQGRMLLMK